eukprot:7257342-Pyramimonas_sp.AAC.1
MSAAPIRRPKWGQNRSNINDFGFKEEQRGLSPSPRQGQNPREGRRFVALRGVEMDPPNDPPDSLSRSRGTG